MKIVHNRADCKKRIDTCLPREGPETGMLLLLQMFHLCIATYLPREGRKLNIERSRVKSCIV